MNASHHRTPVQLTAAQLLDALEGVAYLTDPAGTIIAIGQRGWDLFATDNAVPWLNAQAVLGTSLFAAIQGDTVRDAYRRLHAAVVDGWRAQTVFDYRCDSPIAERHMRMAITPVLGPLGVAGVLYQSQIVAEAPRLPVPLFSAEARVSMERRPAPPSDQIVVLCSFCQRLAWPIGARERARRWISPVEFYRRGGPEDAVVSDGICPPCAKRVVEPNT
jgi:hypothetical protein